MGEEEGTALSAGERVGALIDEPREISSVVQLDVDPSRLPSLREADQPLGAEQLEGVMLELLVHSHSFTGTSSTVGAYLWTLTTTSLGAQLSLIGINSMLVARASGATVPQRATSSTTVAVQSRPLNLLLQQ
jgi:hypothetical protein